MIGTALCPDSRNRKFGECLGKGLTGEQALKRVKQTVEGISAVHCLLRLARKHKARVPFAEMIDRCVSVKRDSRHIFKDYLRQSIVIK